MTPEVILVNRYTDFLLMLCVIVCFAWFSAGCSDSQAQGCSSGQNQTCSCSSGQSGTRSCSEDGTWGDCLCGDGGIDGDQDSDGCLPDCQDRDCGDDGCGGSCGDCDQGFQCTDDGQCEAEPLACSHPELPQCLEIAPEPRSEEEIITFSQLNSLPLRCEQAGEHQWFLDVFIEDFQGMNMFFMGEVHGTQEIGQASIELFHILYEAGMVDAVALEYGMDTTDALNEFVRTGSGDLLSEYWIMSYGRYMFRRLFAEYARQRFVEEGIEIPLYGIDTPQRLAWANEELETIAARLSDAFLSGLIVDTMPEPLEQDEYGMMGVSDAYVESCEVYYHHIEDNLDAICGGLGDEVLCEALEWTAFGLWVGAIYMSEAFYEEIMGVETVPGRMFEWMEMREELIFRNTRLAFLTTENGLFSHMGAGHVSKGGYFLRTAGMMNEDFEPTQGRVYSVNPAWGPGSQIHYGMVQNIDPEPRIVSEALSSMPIENYYLSSALPSFDCVGNPYTDMINAYGMGGSTYGDYNAFFWYRVLSPDIPGSRRSVEDPRRRAVLDSWYRTQAADEYLRSLTY